MAARAIEIMLVEDSEVDAQIVREALLQGKIDNVLHHLTSGQEALDFFAIRDEYKQAVQPDLILLDINLPGIDGIELLKKIKEHVNTKNAHVVMMTSSFSDDDIKKAYDNHAEHYLVKPLDLQKIIDTITNIPGFKLQIVTE